MRILWEELDGVVYWGIHMREWGSVTETSYGTAVSVRRILSSLLADAVGVRGLVLPEDLVRLGLCRVHDVRIVEEVLHAPRTGGSLGTGRVPASVITSGAGSPAIATGGGHHARMQRHGMWTHGPTLAR